MAPEIEFRFDIFDTNSLGGVALDNLKIDAEPEPCNCPDSDGDGVPDVWDQCPPILQ